MHLRDYIEKLPALIVDQTMQQVFDLFLREPSRNFLPVLSESAEPLGIIREVDLKQFTYGRFGRELVRRESLRGFIHHCPATSVNSSVDELLHLVSINPNPLGIIVVEDRTYAGVITGPSLLLISEENRKQTLRRLSQAQKLEAIGTLAGGIAHDFNNILMPIIGYSQLTLGYLEPSQGRIRSNIEQVIQAAMRARDLVAQILAFSRQSKQERMALHVAPIVKEACKLLRSSLPSTIDIKVCVKTEEDLVLADPTEIHQVVMNLCTNAAHAMREQGGVLSITLCDHDGPLLGWSDSLQRKEAAMLRMSVSDTGHGIPQSLMSRIFDPFFTTKGVGEGTGMGLSVVHGIVTSYGGGISVESEPGGGATFHVYLPQAEDEPSIDVHAVSIKTHYRGNNRSVLLVDDEQMILDIAAEALRGIGFRVTPVQNSPEALSIFTARPYEFDAVVTDQTMPALTGAKLAKRILEIRPDVPIVLCTGYSEAISAEMAKAIGIREYLMKPIDFNELAKILCECGSALQ